MMFRIFCVMSDERGLLFFRGSCVRQLEPGMHRLFDPFGWYSIEYYLATDLALGRRFWRLRKAQRAIRQGAPQANSVDKPIRLS
jgi:hypothetical protein